MNKKVYYFTFAGHENLPGPEFRKKKEYKRII